MGAGLLEPPHLILILVIAIVLFGAGKLSDVGSAVGKSVRDFRAAVKEEDPPSKPIEVQATTLKVVKSEDSNLPPKAS